MFKGLGAMVSLLAMLGLGGCLGGTTDFQENLLGEDDCAEDPALCESLDTREPGDIADDRERPEQAECEVVLRACLERCRDAGLGEDCARMCEREAIACEGREIDDTDFGRCLDLLNQCAESCEQMGGDPRCFAGCQIGFNTCTLPREPQPGPCLVAIAACLNVCEEGGNDPVCMIGCERRYWACMNPDDREPDPIARCEFALQECMDRCLVGSSPEQCPEYCERVFHECLAGESEPQPDRCQLMLDECLQSCEGLPDEDCVVACKLRFEDCLGSIVDPQPDPCEQAMQECLRACDLDNPTERCYLACREGYQLCTEEGTDGSGDTDPVEPCMQQFEECLQSCANSDPNECEVACKLRYQACLEG